MKVKHIFLLVLCVLFSSKVISQDVSFELAQHVAEIFTGKDIRPNYPSCTPLVIASSSLWPNNFVVQNGGGITIGDRSISSGMHGVIFSEEYVKLTSGFKVESGAEVYIDIKDMHCEDDRPIISAPRTIHNNPPLIPHNINTTSDDRAQKVFQDGHIYIKRGDNVYNISGMRIK